MAQLQNATTGKIVSHELFILGSSYVRTWKIRIGLDGIFFRRIFFCDTSKLFSVFYQQTDDYHQNDKTLQLLNDTLSFQLMTLLTKNRSVAKYDNLCYESPNTVETQVTCTYIVGTTENRYLHS